MVLQKIPIQVSYQNHSVLGIVEWHLRILIKALSGSGYMTLTMMFIGVFQTFLIDELIYQKQDKGGNCEQIYT